MAEASSQQAMRGLAAVVYSAAGAIMFENVHFEHSFFIPPLIPVNPQDTEL